MELCSEEEMSALVQAIQSDDRGDLAAVDKFLQIYRDDPRLHFMRGSILAARQRHVEAHASLARAVELAPEFHIARYQLGFFELTSGEADKALSTWGPLLRLPEEFYLRKFVEGLTCLIRDEFDQAVALMREGLALSTENEPLNNDIRLLMGEAEKAAKQGKPSDPGEEGSDRSATSVLLGFSDKPTRH
jgi:tetratricopeptide (TPR) repeat protein